MFNEGDVLAPKIANVKLMAEASDTAKAVGTLARTDELVVIGGEKDGFINVQGASGSGWVKIVLDEQAVEDVKSQFTSHEPNLTARSTKSLAVRSTDASGCRSGLPVGPYSSGRGTNAVRRPTDLAAFRSPRCAATIITSAGFSIRKSAADW